MPPPTWLVTGGAGFIGSTFVVSSIAEGAASIVNLDRLTYAGSLDNLAALAPDDPRHLFVEGDILDRGLVLDLLRRHRPAAIVHFAAESHVDRSIDGPGAFVRTNVNGTFELLEATRAFLSDAQDPAFRFLQVSTDEVYGSLGPEGAFTETTPFTPSSPYAASKAAADHLVRSYAVTYGLPTITTHCGNNYGPHQLPEKLIPVVILNARDGFPIPVYGDGLNVRDWLHVSDHCRGLRTALARGRPGETYDLGGDGERTNLEVVHAICDVLDELVGAPATGMGGAPARSHRDLVTFVVDRPGHDRRYAIDAGKARRELGWAPHVPFAEGLRETVTWYLENAEWCGRAAERFDRHRRLGLGAAATPGGGS